MRIAEVACSAVQYANRPLQRGGSAKPSGQRHAHTISPHRGLRRNQHVAFSPAAVEHSHNDGNDEKPREDPMGIGLGIVLIVIGAILLWALNVNVPFMSDNALGIILIVVGALAIVLSLVINQQRTRRTTVVDDRRDPPVR